MKGKELNPLELSCNIKRVVNGNSQWKLYNTPQDDMLLKDWILIHANGESVHTFHNHMGY